ncbi:type VI secretion system contractile sheath small subunit [Candidatus Manganitrophus noduliformans]|uniref:Type VI secretion system contractile sheath small subunit n=1 Tax=Candidatus Manganitrophus noduliformans TaxID=2606439 RepID=A0A7X6DST7_9BACT|nr:type VI secretion system contractile sheath small subunit [Candidatus Manganitrophus noduliformans]NKE72393.1 type VI secretion system contractile sheath small subunit [Candidatus Manganitrophus noduliformans]
MAKESSVAPKERVNIVYKPATGGAQAEVELPLKMLMMGDYTLRSEETALEDRKPINIDKDNFEEVMRNQELKISLNVANKLSGKEGEELPVNLKFEKMKDFGPESVVEQVPELNKLLQLRTALQALKGPLGNIPAFRKKIEGLISDVAAREKLLKELGGENK